MVRSRSRRVRGGGFFGNFRKNISQSYSNANTDTGVETYKKAICDAPYRGARAMSRTYSGQIFARNIRCDALNDEQKQLFDSWQNELSGECHDPHRCMKTALTEERPKSTNPFDNPFAGGRRHKSRRRRLSGGRGGSFSGGRGLSAGGLSLGRLSAGYSCRR